jgi:glutamate dehydrogenase (NADP+)
MNRGGGVPRHQEHVDLNGFIEGVTRRNPGQPEFVQAVTEVAQDIFEFIENKPNITRRRSCAASPSPTASSRSASAGRTTTATVRVNRGYRVQNNNAIGPIRAASASTPR